jgi:hypothetical protein
MTMCTVSAAHPLADDYVVASPELALVDADLAERLRAGLATEDVFRPRPPPRAELTLVTTEVDADVAPDASVVGLDGEATNDVRPVSEAPEDAVPDYIVPTGEEPVDRLSAYDFIVGRDDLGDVPEAPVPVVAPLDDAITVDDEAVDLASADDLVVEHEEIGRVEAPVVIDEPSSDYPVLPALDERIEALEETDAALRRIREQMGDEQSGGRKARVRRRLVVLSGLGAAAALAVLAVDLQTGIAHLPGF